MTHGKSVTAVFSNDKSLVNVFNDLMMAIKQIVTSLVLMILQKQLILFKSTAVYHIILSPR